MTGRRLILASASPRRRELLDQLGARYTCDPADIDESHSGGEVPTVYVRRMALEKAGAVYNRHANSNVAVLAADTCVVIDGTVLGKPRDKPDALGMLASLSGRTHDVFTAVCLRDALAEVVTIVQTRVEFTELTPQTCESYLATGEAWDKAGAYAIQGLGGALVRSIQGSYSNVVGLPLCETWKMLCAGGIVTALPDA